MSSKKEYTFQEWLPFEKILEDGIVKLKDNTYVKILKILPINYNLKSDLEKEAILSSYQLFLKTCDFDIQILIQSNKEDFSNHISIIEKESQKEENQKLVNIFKKYIDFIQNKVQRKDSSSKNFFILIKYPQIRSKEEIPEEMIKSNLNEKYFKIKECLARCGNFVYEYNKREETMKLFYSCFNYRQYNNSINKKVII